MTTITSPGSAVITPSELVPSSTSLTPPSSNSITNAKSTKPTKPLPPLQTGANVVSGTRGDVLVDNTNNSSTTAVRAMEVSKGFGSTVVVHDNGKNSVAGTMTIDRNNGLATSLFLPSSSTPQSNSSPSSNAPTLFKGSLFGSNGLPSLGTAIAKVSETPQGYSAVIFVNGMTNPLAIAQTVAPDDTSQTTATSDMLRFFNTSLVPKTGTPTPDPLPTSPVVQNWSTVIVNQSFQATDFQGNAIVNGMVRSTVGGAYGISELGAKGAISGSVEAAVQLKDQTGNPLLESYLRSLGVGSFSLTNGTNTDPFKFNIMGSGAAESGLNLYSNGQKLLTTSLQSLGSGNFSADGKTVYASGSGATELSTDLRGQGISVDADVKALGAGTFSLDSKGINLTGAGAIEGGITGFINGQNKQLTLDAKMQASGAGALNVDSKKNITKTDGEGAFDGTIQGSVKAATSALALPSFTSSLPLNQVLNWSVKLDVSATGSSSRTVTVQKRATLVELLGDRLSSSLSSATNFAQELSTALLKGVNVGAIAANNSISVIDTTLNQLLKPFSSVSNVPNGLSYLNPSLGVATTALSGGNVNTVTGLVAPDQLVKFQANLGKALEPLAKYDLLDLQKNIDWLTNALKLPKDSLKLENPQATLDTLAKQLGVDTSQILNTENPQAALTDLAEKILAKVKVGDKVNDAKKTNTSQATSKSLRTSDVVKLLENLYVLPKSSASTQPKVTATPNSTLNSTPNSTQSTPVVSAPSSQASNTVTRAANRIQPTDSDSLVVQSLGAQSLGAQPEQLTAATIISQVEPIDSVIQNAVSRRDRTFGSNTNDLLNGELGNDWLAGGLGDDQLWGGDGGDRLLGNRGNDHLLGEAGNDRLVGGKGHDRLVGGSGLNFLTGGRGRDTFVLQKGEKFDLIRDFQVGQDRLELVNVQLNQVSLLQVGRHTQVWVDGDRLAVLQNVVAEQLQANSFVV
jgi:Ca2+-binding RTX toxin-like protein